MGILKDLFDIFKQRTENEDWEDWEFVPPNGEEPTGSESQEGRQVPESQEGRQVPESQEGRQVLEDGRIRIPLNELMKIIIQEDTDEATPTPARRVRASKRPRLVPTRVAPSIPSAADDSDDSDDEDPSCAVCQYGLNPNGEYVVVRPCTCGAVVESAYDEDDEDDQNDEDDEDDEDEVILCNECLEDHRMCNHFDDTFDVVEVVARLGLEHISESSS